MPVCALCGGRVRAAGTPGAERRLASDEIRTAADVVRLVRYCCGTSAVSALGLVLAGIRDLSLSNGNDSFAGVLFVGAWLIANVAGFQLAPFHPFGASLALALLGTAGVLWGLVGGQIQICGLVFALVFWVCALVTRRTGRTLRAHPELFAARKLLGIEASAGADPEARRVAAIRRAWRRVGLTATILVALVSVGSAAAWWARPRELEPILRAFTEAWNASRTEPVVAFFPSDARAREAERFGAALRAIPQWPFHWPKIVLPPASLEGGNTVGDTARRSFSLEEWRPGAALETNWQRSSWGWSLTELSLLPDGE